MTDQVISNIFGVPLRGAITFLKLEVQVGQYHRSYFYLYYLDGVQKEGSRSTQIFQRIHNQVWATFVVGRRPEESITECRTLSSV
jgi:hypothetical protein